MYIVPKNGATVTIFAPYDCGNNCPFCVNKKEYKENPNFNLVEVVNSIIRMDWITPNCDYVITGGEPLADLYKFERIVLTIRALNLNGSNHKLFINTTLPIKREDIDAVAVTYGAGLVGALLVGVNFAKSLAYALDVPLIGVSHVKGHIAANYISHKNLEPPFVCLMVSGGHTALLKIANYNQMEILGQSVDDAVGEAFDKVARVLGLCYPGGPEVEKLALSGKKKYNFTISNSLKNTFNFSFSGIKTEIVNLVHNKSQKNEEIDRANIAYSFQECVCDELSNKAVKACEEIGLSKLVVAGGVGANGKLREKLQEKCDKNNIKLFTPVLKYCTDNGAMIGAMAYFMIRDGLGLCDPSLTAKANVELRSN